MVVAAPAGDILLLERASPPGFWQSVTGSLEAGESPREAAVREVFEETGFDAGDGLVDLRSEATFTIAPRWRHRYAPGVNHNREHHFAVVLPSRRPPQLQPSEHIRSRWMGWHEAFGAVTSWTNRTALLALRRRDLP